MGVPISGLAHRTIKRTIEALACWNYTQRLFYTVVPVKSGISKHMYGICKLKHFQVVNIKSFQTMG